MFAGVSRIRSVELALIGTSTSRGVITDMISIDNPPYARQIQHYDVRPFHLW